MEAHQLITGLLADKKTVLESVEAKVKKVQADVVEVKADLDAANKKIDENSLFVSNKDTKILKLREELNELGDQRLHAVSEYRKSMDFISRLANRYNGGWYAAMRCAKHTIPNLDWFKVKEAHDCPDFELSVEGEILDRFEYLFA